MPGRNLTTASTVQCPHQGIALLLTSNTKAFAEGAPMLLESDVHAVLGCVFVVALKPSPCLRVEWTAGASKVTVNGVKTLIETSVGKCINAENLPQGLAIVQAGQMKVSST
jgi:hypothetical protein